jgi:hypothetical protein
MGPASFALGGRCRLGRGVLEPAEARGWNAAYSGDSGADYGERRREPTRGSTSRMTTVEKRKVEVFEDRRIASELRLLSNHLCTIGAEEDVSRSIFCIPQELSPFTGSTSEPNPISTLQPLHMLFLTAIPMSLFSSQQDASPRRP